MSLLIFMTQPDTSSLAGQVYLVHQSPTTVDQFRPGAGGDLIDLSEVLRLRYFEDDGTNPFADGGVLKLVQRGADTVLQWANYGNFEDVLLLRNVVASSLVAANFVGNIPPDGSPVPGIVQQGTDAADKLHGTEFADTITGMAGDDELRGDGGRDAIEGGKGNDSVFGGQGNDTLRGGDGDDLIVAGKSFDDRLLDFSNSLEGGDGNDTLIAEAGLDTLDGGSGDDTLYVGSNTAIARGGAGNDTFIVQTRQNTVVHLDGEEGSDTYAYDIRSYYAPYAGGSIEISGFKAGAGGDVIDIERSLSYVLWNDNPFGEVRFAQLVQQGNDVAVQFDFDAGGTRFGMNTVFLLKDVAVANIAAENLGGIPPDGSPVRVVRHGTDGNDDLYNPRFDTEFHGGAGDDTLSGGMGEARLYGDAGNDVIKGGSGATLMDGGAGNDTLTSGRGDATMFGGAGDDQLYIGVGAVSADGGDGDDVLVMDYYDQYSLQKPITVSGGAGRDTFAPGWDTSSILAVTVADFEAGSGGDRIDLGMLLTSDHYPDGAVGENPFTPAAGILKLVQDGADTWLQVGEKQGPWTGWHTVLVLKNVVAAHLTAVNFVGAISPDGSPVAGSTLIGTAAGETLVGTFFGDTLTGMGGDDWLRGGAGNDSLAGGTGDDTLSGDGGSDTLLGGDGNDYLYERATGEGSQSIDGGAGNDVIDFETGHASVRGGDGDDTFVVRIRAGAAVTMDGGAGRDTFQLVGEAPFDGRIRIDGFAPGRGGDVIDLAKVLEQMLGTDYTGDNPFQTGALRLLQEGTDVVLQWRQYQSYATVLTLAGVSLADLANDNFGGLAIDGAPMSGQLTVADGKNTYVAGASFADTIVGAGIDEHIYGLAGSDSLLGGGGDDRLDGGLGDDYLDGGDGKDRLDGQAGNDTLAGRAGDTLFGGDGDDRYVLLERGALVDTYQDDGLDTVEVRFAGAFTLAEGLDNLVAGVAGAVQLAGNKSANSIAGAAGNDVLEGGDGNDTLDGGTGGDTLVGGAGEDIYVIDSRADVIVENEGYGNGVITSLDSFALTDYFYSLRYTGSGNFAGTGSAYYNLMEGGSGDDTLAGRDGDDTLNGGQGGDRLAGDNGNDVLDGGAGSDTLSGGEGSDSLFGGDGDDTLDGGTGRDYLNGGDGDDVYLIDEVSDRIEENDHGGVDEVRVGLSRDGFYVLSNHVENGTVVSGAATKLYGNGLANVLKGASGSDTLIGLDGNDTLDGGAGADQLEGGAGDDLYIVDAAGDTIVEAVDGGNDSVLTTLARFTLGGNIESLAYTGTGSFNGIGNGLANVIAGGSGNDTLDGLAGADQMRGGTGDDTYIVDNAADRIIENAGEGHDTVQVTLAKGSYALAANVEDAKVTSTGAVGITGNELANTLTGNGAANRLEGGAGNDTLDGGKGSDVLIGGLGNDTYYVDAAGDKVTELADEGTDTVITALAKYTLGANVENVTYTGTSAFTATGNALDNVITGGSGNNTIDGGAGNDTFVVSGAFAEYTRQRPNATDVVLTKGTQKITLKNIEQVQFSDGLKTMGDIFFNIASQANDTLAGTDGNDSLDGLAGADQLSGGQGDDTYVVDNTADTIVEKAGEGSDTVQVALAKGSYTLAANVEHGTVTGKGAAGIVGNELANTLTGNGAANRLDGGVGNDTLDGGKGSDVLTGGSGNDTFYVDAAGDKVIELADEGVDTVFTTLAKYTLGANVENLIYMGTSAFTATGNALDNVITGGNGNNTIDGGAGNDTFVVSGAFAEYTRQRPNATDVVLTKGSQKITLKNIEQVQFSDGKKTMADIFYNIASLADDTLVGTDGNDTMNGQAGADQMSGGKGDDTYLVDNAGDTAVEKAGEGIDMVNVAIKSKATYTLADNVEHATITSTTAVSLIGNAADNRLTGNAAANALTGGDGNDTLIGGKGNDTLDGGAGNDVYSVDAAGDKVIEAENGGYDIVETTASKYTLAANVEELRFTGKGAFTGTGNALDNVIIGGAGNDKLTGGAGADTFVIGTGTDTITDFASGIDRLKIDRAIGNGNGGIDGAVVLEAVGGFSSNAELVIFAQAVKSLKPADVAKVIGSATDAYANGDTALFALHDAKGTALFLFTSSGDDAVVSASELKQIATLTGVTAASAADFAFD